MTIGHRPLGMGSRRSKCDALSQPKPKSTVAPKVGNASRFSWMLIVSLDHVFFPDSGVISSLNL